MTAKSLTCSLVVRAYNEEQHIGRLLEGVRHQTLKGVDLILVDSGSTDATPAIASRYGARILHIPPGEFTFGRSLNIGVQAAACDLVAVASAHVYPVYPDWLERLLAPLSDPKIALAYGKQRGSHTTKFSEGQIFAHWFPEQSNPRQEHPFCNNANAAIRRGLWERHPYDESLTGLEDLAWAKWALGESFFLAYVAEAEVVHVHNETPGGVRRRYEREAMAFKRLYPEAHFSLYDFLRTALANISNDLKHAALARVFWRSLVSIHWFRWMQFWGTYLGYRRTAELDWQLRRTFYYPRSPGQDSAPARAVEPIRYDERE